MRFDIANSDPALLDRAHRIAQDFARPWQRDGIAGIVFVGAIARGYFDASADIDIALFRRRGADLTLPDKFTTVDGLEVHCWNSDYEDELDSRWDMARRWTFSQSETCYDPRGYIARLLEDKVPLKPEERRWMLMSGLVLSEWYSARLPRTWVERGSITSAHQALGQALDHFATMLFALNNELVPDPKWRHYCLERLPLLPQGILDSVRQTMILRSFSPEELGRRQRSFAAVWQAMRPVVERELQMTYDEMKAVV